MPHLSEHMKSPMYLRQVSEDHRTGALTLEFQTIMGSLEVKAHEYAETIDPVYAEAARRAQQVQELNKPKEATKPMRHPAIDALDTAIRQVQADRRQVTSEIANLEEQMRLKKLKIQELNRIETTLDSAKRELQKRAPKCQSCGGSGKCSDMPVYPIGNVPPKFEPVGGRACPRCHGTGYAG